MLGITLELVTLGVAVLGGVRGATTTAASAIPSLGFFNSSVNGGAWLTVSPMILSFP